MTILSKNCWIQPDGKILEVEYETHLDKACEFFDSELAAELAGWAKISWPYYSNYPENIYKKKELTQKQLDSVFDFCNTWDLDYKVVVECFKDNGDYPIAYKRIHGVEPSHKEEETVSSHEEEF